MIENAFLSQEEIKHYENLYKNGLLEDIIPFWMKNCIDKEDGGFMFCLDRDGSVLDTDKGVWQTGRCTWMFAKLYNEVEQRPEWLEIAKHGADFLMNHCFDESGKMYFTVNKKGEPLRMRRYAYSESFAAIAFAGLYKATGEDLYKEKAIHCFGGFIKYNTEEGLFPPKVTNRESRGMGFPMIGIATAQEMRLNLGDDSYTTYVDEWINYIAKYFMNEEYKAVMEMVGPNGELLDHFDGRTLNPGHAIEGAWFVLEEAKYRNNDEKLMKLGLKMLDWMWEIGWDKEYGGIIYFRDVKGLPVQEYWQDMKFWWPQCEAIIATSYAYEMTGDEKYAKWHKMINEYALENFSDKEHGEWYGYLHRDGRISIPSKGNIWKGPFHIPRMYFKAWKSFEAMSEKYQMLS